MKQAARIGIAMGLGSLATCLSWGADLPTPVAASGAMPAGRYVLQRQLADSLAAAVAKPSDPAVAPIGVTDQYSISEVRRKADGVPAIHPEHTELHFILDGSGTLVTGGKIVTPPGSKTAVIEGGVAREVNKGDAVILPQNTPHWYQNIDGGLTYLEVRFLVPGASPPGH